MEKVWPQIFKEQSDVAFKFLECLFSKDVTGYWDLISKVDKARVYGMYRQYINEIGFQELSFKDYVTEHIMPDHAKNYEGLRDNTPGLSTTLRHTDQGEALLYLMDNIEEPKIMEEETLAYVFPLILTLDANYDNEQTEVVWKVRIYQDKLYDEI